MVETYTIQLFFVTFTREDLFLSDAVIIFNVKLITSCLFAAVSLAFLQSSFAGIFFIFLSQKFLFLAENIFPATWAKRLANTEVLPFVFLVHFSFHFLSSRNLDYWSFQGFSISLALLSLSLLIFKEFLASQLLFKFLIFIHTSHYWVFYYQIKEFIFIVLILKLLGWFKRLFIQNLYLKLLTFQVQGSFYPFLILDLYWFRS